MHRRQAPTPQSCTECPPFLPTKPHNDTFQWQQPWLLVSIYVTQGGRVRDDSPSEYHSLGGLSQHLHPVDPAQAPSHLGSHLSSGNSWQPPPCLNPRPRGPSSSFYCP